MGFNHTSTTDDVLAGISLRNKTAVVTGASSGLGIETCRALASAGATVVMAVRDLQKGAQAADSIRAEQPDADLQLVQLELSDLHSVRCAAAELLARLPTIEILINNAGIMATPLQRTAEGCESQFGTNHIGHFLFTCLLAPALIAADHARVVNLSSAGHKASSIDLDDLHFEQKSYDKWEAYGQAKTANALFSLELGKRLKPHGVTANSVHPGMIATDLARHMTRDDIREMAAAAKEKGVAHYKSIPQGAATSVWAATAPELAERSGLYLEDCQVSGLESERDDDNGCAPYLFDEALAAELWKRSEAIVGEAFSF